MLQPKSDHAEAKHVFVYGTLLTGMPNHHIIQPFVKNIQLGKTSGVLYLIYGYPAMTMVAETGADETGNDQYVSGEVVELIRVPEALKVLDELEDYKGPQHPDNLYERIVRPVFLESGQEVSAYVYIWGNGTELEQIGEKVASGNWKRLCGTY